MDDQRHTRKVGAHGFATDMRSLEIPRKTCAVSLLLFATSIGHVIFSGEAKGHIKNLLYSLPVTIEDQCQHFVAIARPATDSHVSDCYCETAWWYGRLGNRLSSTSKMISEAESLSCGVHIPKDMLSGWVPPEHSWVHIRNESLHNVSMAKNNTCGARGGKQWYFSQPSSSPRCHLQLLREYFNINQTHVLGKTCSSTEHVALHVRAGDVTLGHWGEDDTYKPAGVHGLYSLFPTAFYTSVMSEIRARRGNSVIFFVFCENMGNPTCEFYEKLSTLDQNVVLRVSQPLIDDLRLMLCASEVAESNGSFRGVFGLSPKPQVRHTFSHTPMHGVERCSKVLHWISSSEQAAKFWNITNPWKNTGFQRHEVNAAYDMSRTEIDTRRPSTYVLQHGAVWFHMVCS